MRARLILCVMMLVITKTGCGQVKNLQVERSIQLKIEAIALKLTNNEVGRIDVLQIPARILTRTRITPEMLERQFHYKLTIRDLRGGAYQDSIANAVKSITVQRATEIPDVRWGVVFYGKDDSRIGALYLDKSGFSGVVDYDPVSFRGDLFKWLDGNFSRCFR